jgi:hypothetical protein
MTLQQLIERFRIEADDLANPPLWRDEWIIDWFAEAQDEAAVRARLLLDDYSASVTKIAVAPGIASYPLHPKVYEIAALDFVPNVGVVENLRLVSREYLDRTTPGWRDFPSEMPSFAIQTDTRLRLVPVPSVAGTLRMEAYRLPLKAMASDNDKPEIHEAHHIHLVHWVLYRAFGRPDADAQNPQKSKEALEDFESYFGLRPDADLRQSTRHDQTQVNVSHVL